MFEITKEEAKELRRTHPRVYIVSTMKHHARRGKYYIEEAPSSLNALREIRERNGGEQNAVDS